MITKETVKVAYDISNAIYAKDVVSRDTLSIEIYLLSDLEYSIKLSLQDEEDELDECEVEWYDQDLNILENLYTLDEQTNWLLEHYTTIDNQTFENWQSVYEYYKSQEWYDTSLQLDTLLTYLISH